MAYVLTIGGVEQFFDPTTLQITETANGRNNLSVEIPAPGGAYRPNIGDEVYLDENGTRIFGGVVETPGEVGMGGEGRFPIVNKLNVPDFNTYADRRYAVGEVQYNTLKAQLELLVMPYLTPFGITLHPSQVDGPMMSGFPCDFVQVSQLLDQMATISSYAWEIDYYKRLRMYQPSVTPAPFNITSGDGNCIGDVTVERSRADYANRIILRFTNGAIAAWGFLTTDGQNFSDHDQVVVGSSTYTFKLVMDASHGTVKLESSYNDSLHNLADAIVNGGNGATCATGTPPNSQVSAWITWPDQMKVVAQTPGASGNNIAATTTSATGRWLWEGNQPISALYGGADEALTGQVEANDQTQQSLYGMWEKIVSAQSVRDYNVATDLVNSLLQQSTSTITTAHYVTARTGVHPGQTQTINVPERGLSGIFTITDVTISLLETHARRAVTVTGGSIVTKRWQDDAKVMLGGGGGGTTIGAFVISSGPTGGNGTGGGPQVEEVFVGPTDPGVPVELWFDVDEPAPPTTIPDHSIDLIKLQPIPTQTLLGRATPGVGDVEILTVLPTAVQNSITRLGTVVSGVWNATPIGLTYVAGAGAAGTFIRSTGTAWATSTLTLPNTVPLNSVIYATGPNALGSSPNLTFSGSALALVGDQTITGFIGSATYASQTTGWRIDSLGGSDFRYLFVDEMHAKSFITDLEMALAGGQIIAKSVAMVAAPFTVPANGGVSTLRVRDLPSMADVAAYQSGDTVMLRRFSRTGGALSIEECVGVVSGYVDQPDGTQTWSFTRGTGASGGSMSGGLVSVDSLAIDYGVSGNGYYEVNAIDGAYGVNSPYAQIVTWTTAPTGPNKVIRTRFGKLTGITGVGNEYGMIAGAYAASNGSYFRASNTTFELHNITAQWWAGFTPVVVISPGSGSPSISLGNPAYAAFGQGPGIVLSYSASAGLAQFWAYSPGGSNYLVFDGSLLYWKAANTTLDTAGNLTATSASLSGAITATSGLVSGDFVIGTGGQMRSGANSYSAGVGWWLDYNAGVPRFRIGNPNADRVAWDGTTLTVRSGKLLIDGSANGHIGMGAAPYSIAMLNIAADTDDASSYGLLVTNHSGTISSLLTYGDGRLFLGGQLYILPGAWDTTGQGSNPPSILNGPFGSHELSGWMRVYMYTGGGGGIPPTGPYSRGWIPVWLG